MPPKTFYKHCLKCNRPFSTFSEIKIYCNDVCELRDRVAKKSRELGITDKTIGAIKCPGCNIYFVRRNRENYCNQICWENHYHRKIKEKKEELRKRNPIEQICPVCKSKFIALTRGYKYCSNLCAKKIGDENFEKLKAKKREENAKAGKKKRKIPYHVLNMIAEKKRLDEEWDRLTR